jgi:hypothetical protein
MFEGDFADKFSKKNPALVNESLIGGSSVCRPRSEDSHQREGKLYSFRYNFIAGQPVILFVYFIL